MSYGWSNRAPRTAKAVAEAFYAGKTRKRGNCCTDGSAYYLFGHPIARRVPDHLYVHHALAALRSGELLRPLEFSFAGWVTSTTCRHLEALGVRTSRAGGVPMMNGKVVHHNYWYTLAELEALPAPVRSKVERRSSRVCEKTMELFPA